MCQKADHDVAHPINGKEVQDFNYVDVLINLASLAYQLTRKVRKMRSRRGVFSNFIRDRLSDLSNE
jgi:hypothetical protein